jgi:aminopeptidase N
VHEVAHQWFGNLVTMKWYDDLWLKEGFSTYLHYVATQEIKPEWDYFKTITMNEFQKAMPKDSDASSRPISFPVKTKSDIRRVFDPISYSKGALIINMMRGFLGETTFRMGLKNYLKKFEYGNAVQDDLWEAMTFNARKDAVLDDQFTVKQIMDSWTVDSAGYPVVTVERNGTDIIISQHRYFLPHINENDTTKWFIPISYATKSRQPNTEIPDYWLPNTDKQLVIHNAVAEDEWIYLNLNRTGYYRVNYDQLSWKNLITNLSSLSDVTRAQLIDDAFNLARADLTGYDIPITLGLVIRGSAPFEYMSWWAFANGLQYITNMIKREPAYESYRTVMKFIIKLPYEELGFEELDDETDVELLHRARIVDLACEFGIDRCTNTAQLLFREWIGNKAENK